MAEEIKEQEKPVIVGSVRLGEDLYLPGSETKLAKKATAEQLEHLAKKGVISGPWPKKTEPVSTAPVESGQGNKSPENTGSKEPTGTK